MSVRGEPRVESQTPLVEIVVDEDLTAQAAGRLRLLLSDALDLRPAQLVVDLGGCSYADAVAVKVLLTAHRWVWSMGGRLTLRAPTPRVQRLLRLARLDHVSTSRSPPSRSRPPKSRRPRPPGRGL
jgi:anti-anti-sigma factor